MVRACVAPLVTSKGKSGPVRCRGSGRFCVEVRRGDIACHGHSGEPPVADQREVLARLITSFATRSLSSAIVPMTWWQSAHRITASSAMPSRILKLLSPHLAQLSSIRIAPSRTAVAAGVFYRKPNNARFGSKADISQSIRATPTWRYDSSRQCGDLRANS